MKCVICLKSHNGTYQGCNKCRDKLMFESKDKLLEGGGILSDIQRAFERVKNISKKIVYGPNSLSPDVKTFLKDNPSKIISVVIDRSPIRKEIVILANAGSLGKFNKILKSTPYDKIFHLRLNITLEDGTICCLEKNEIISLTKKKLGESKSGHDLMPISTFPYVTLSELLLKVETLLGVDKMYRYNAKHNNCQDFALACLNSVGINEVMYVSFIKQDIKEVFNSNPWYRSISNFFTGIAARREVIRQGGKIENR